MTIPALALLLVALSAAVLSLPGTVELALLTIGGLLPARRTPRASRGRQDLTLAIVIPAHNEEAGLPQCLKSMADAGAGPGEIVVVADNCTDRTAEVAAECGARVLEREDTERRGKGFALQFAFARLLKERVDAFLVIDADSVVPQGFFQAMRSCFLAGADAVQCRYLVRNPSGSMRTRLMNLALLAFNAFRLRGRQRWGLSAGILGNGFGMTRKVLETVPYDASSVVEDLEYHLRLVSAGRRVEFVEATCVYGEMPVRGAGVKTQRARWEGGRLRMMGAHAWPLFLRVISGQPRLAEPLLELLLLPLGLHVTLLAIVLAAPSPWLRGYAALSFGLILVHLAGAVWRCGGGWRDLAALAAAPFYVVWKILMLPLLIRTSRSSAAWVRTERVATEGRK